MGAIGVVLLVAFIIVCVLLILLVSVQDNEDGMGGVFGGRGTAAFGSHSASVLTKSTAVFVVLFFVLAFGLALVNKKPSIEKDLIVDEATATEEVSTTETTESADWWAESETTDAAATEEKAE
jgi:preprotein translocase subunit SecG